MSTQSSPSVEIEVSQEQLLMPRAVVARTMPVSASDPFLVRAFEVFMSALALTITAPIMLLVTILIRLESAGPIIFVSKRLGIDGRPFTFYKFRTMYSDARQRFPELYAYKFSDSERHTMKFKIDDDPRITPIGKWLRATSLDEFPNFWCVLKGDMALVGPRPEIPEMLPYYHGEMLRKFSVRPGITGIAQVSGRGDLLFKETVACDLEYVRNRTFWLDLKILLKTVVAVFSRRGAV